MLTHSNYYIIFKAFLLCDASIDRIGYLYEIRNIDRHDFKTFPRRSVIGRIL